MDIDLSDELFIELTGHVEEAVNYLEFGGVQLPEIPSPHTSLFTNSNYPTQYENRDTHFCGEYRGSYHDRWKPSSSKFGYVRISSDGKKKFHNAVDIYAPKHTPVVAVCDGFLEIQPDNGKAIGARAWLWFSSGGTKWRFVYGHLDSFEGVNRNVSRGDIIGYSGCSGNSGDVGCGKKNKCGFLPDHVHLILMSGSDNFVDPSTALNWKIRYENHDKDDSDCSDLITQAPV